MTPELIRGWAKATGIEIGARGRIPKEIREQYIKARLEYAPGSVVEPKPAPVLKAVVTPKPRKPRPLIRAESARIAGPNTTLVTNDPIRVVGTQGHWRFLALVIEPDGSVYVDCVDPGGIGRAIRPTQLELPRRGITPDSVRPSLEERQASATAHQPRRAS